MAEEILYRAHISHSEKTVELLYKMQYYVYEKLRMLLRMVIGFLLVLAAALAALPTWAKAVLLLLGAWLLVSRDFPAAVRADRALSARKAALPDMDYTFYSDRIHLTGEGSMDIPYGKITVLAEDAGYLYLFVSRSSVCMLERASLGGAEAEFRKFLAGKTGLEWRMEKSFLSMSIYDLRQALRDSRTK